MSPTDCTHASLLLRLRDRTDELSWPEFHARYGHLLYRYARTRGAAHADAEDAVQEVEMQFFRTIDGFEYDARKGRLRAYLRVAVLHALARRANKQAQERCVELDPRTPDRAAEFGAEADATWDLEWQLNRLRQATEAISGEFEPAAVKAFEMHVLAGRPVTETAAELKISKWRVYRAKARILRRLREQLAELDPDGDA